MRRQINDACENRTFSTDIDGYEGDTLRKTFSEISHNRNHTHAARNAVTSLTGLIFH